MAANLPRAKAEQALRSFRANSTQGLKNRRGTCRGVEIFATGYYPGRGSYGHRDLEEIARNFARLGGRGLKLLFPPVVLGHEAKQDYLDRTDLPAAGWVENVRKVGDRLVADFVDVSPDIAKLINDHAYRWVSAEIYNDFPDDFGRTYGKAIRRVSLLGGEVPMVKRLGPIPVCMFGERWRTTFIRPHRAKSTKRGTFICFSEVSLMDRNALVQQLMAAMPGLKPEIVDTFTEEQIQDLVNNAPAATAPAEVAMMADLTREEMVSELVAQGQDAMALEAMSEEEIKGLYDQLMGAAGAVAPMADVGGVEMTHEEMIAQLTQMGEDPAKLATLTDEELAEMLKSMGAPTPPPAVTAMSERGIKSRQREVIRDLDEINRRNKLLLWQQKFKEASAFCEGLTGKLPNELKKLMVRVLIKLDDTKTVATFSESKVVKQTELQEFKSVLSRLPKFVHFGERLPGPRTAATSAQKALANATEFAEKSFRSPEHKEAYIAKFSEMYKKNPKVALSTLPEQYR